MILRENGELTAPDFEYILKGTTMMRLLDLVNNELKNNSILNSAIRSVEIGHIDKDEIFNAREIMMVGTTMGILPVSKIENKVVGSFRSSSTDKNLLPVLTHLFDTDLIN